MPAERACNAERAAHRTGQVSLSSLEVAVIGSFRLLRFMALGSILGRGGRLFRRTPRASLASLSVITARRLLGLFRLFIFLGLLFLRAFLIFLLRLQRLSQLLTPHFLCFLLCLGFGAETFLTLFLGNARLFTPFLAPACLGSRLFLRYESGHAVAQVIGLGLFLCQMRTQSLTVFLQIRHHYVLPGMLLLKVALSRHMTPECSILVVFGLRKKLSLVFQFAHLLGYQGRLVVAPFRELLEIAHPSHGLAEAFRREDEGKSRTIAFLKAHLLHRLQIFLPHTGNLLLAD